ncbi:hypothetical protein C8R46DRAFT_1067702, partial [Mycena filopes]
MILNPATRRGVLVWGELCLVRVSSDACRTAVHSFNEVSSVQYWLNRQWGVCLRWFRSTGSTQPELNGQRRGLARGTCTRRVLLADH